MELRAYLEKIRPIDKQLSYQIDKLLKAAAAANQQQPAQQPQQRKAAAAAEPEDEGAAGPGPGSAGAGLDGDALRYGPRPDALVPKAKSGVGLAAAGADADGGCGRKGKGRAAGGQRRGSCLRAGIGQGSRAHPTLPIHVPSLVCMGHDRLSARRRHGPVWVDRPPRKGGRRLHCYV